MNVLVRRIAVAAAAIYTITPFAQATQPPAAIDQYARLQAELRRSHESGDSATYLATAQSFYLFLNGSPPAALQLMSAETIAAKPDEALSSFAQFVTMGQAGEDALQGKTFDPLRRLPEYQSIHASMAANTVSISAASQVFSLQTTARIPEDIDYDPDSKKFFVSTVLGKQVLKVDMAGQSTVFASAPDNWPLFALKIDSHRHVLWLTEVALDGFTATTKKDWGRSAILQYDLQSGKLLHRIEGPPKTALGDMALAVNGDPIVSDGKQGGVYRLNGKTWSLERIDAGEFVSPQTAAVLADGKHILVPDYVRGLGLLDLNSKQVVWIPMDGKYALNGIDGLYAIGSRLIATQNGTSPERVVQFTLDGPRQAIIAEKIIERATMTLGDPTHGVVVGNYFFYIANSGWDALDEHGKVLAGKSLPAPLIMRADLGE